MHIVLILQLLALLAVANTAPLIAKKLFRGRFAYPLDAGLVLSDGQPLLGPSKTIRGVVVAVAATAAGAALVGLPVGVGILVGSTAMIGDVFASFVKRRLKRASSSKSTGLDQIPEALLPLIASRALLPVTVLDILMGTVLFFLGEIVLARLFYYLRLRDEPY